MCSELDSHLRRGVLRLVLLLADERAPCGDGEGEGGVRAQRHECRGRHRWVAVAREQGGDDDDLVRLGLGLG